MTLRLILQPLLVTALLVASPLARATAQPRSDASARETIVMPFENPLTEPRLYWLGEGSAVLLADYFDAFSMPTIPRDSRVAAFERLQLPPAAALSHATVIKVAQFVGASDVIVGSYELAGEHLTVRARRIGLEAGRLLPEVTERGPLGELFGIYERVARRLHDLTRPLPAVATGTVLASPAALEAYVKGLVAETGPIQRSYLEQALKLAPRDDRVRLALWQVLSDLGDHAKALDVVVGVPMSSRSARPARYFAALSQIELKRYDQAFEALKALASEGRSAEVVNAMGVIQLLRGSTAQTGKPAYYFNQAAQTDDTDADYFFNLGYAYWTDRDPPAAIYWLREAVRRDPADGDAHYVLGAALQQTGAAAEAAREKELARRLSSSYAEWDKRSAGGGDSVPRGLARVKDRLERPGVRVESMITATGQRDQADLAAFHLDAARRAFAREADREAEQELRRVVFLSPYLADAHVMLGRVYLRAGRTSEAIQALKIALWSDETVAAHLVLAEAHLQLKDVASARAEVDRALVLDPSSADAQALRERLARAKM
jgi:tetratricopeptide (TPR) repeat protein